MLGEQRQLSYKLTVNIWRKVVEGAVMPFQIKRREIEKVTNLLIYSCTSCCKGHLILNTSNKTTFKSSLKTHFKQVIEFWWIMLLSDINCSKTIEASSLELNFQTHPSSLKSKFAIDKSKLLNNEIIPKFPLYNLCRKVAFCPNRNESNVKI